MCFSSSFFIVFFFGGGGHIDEGCMSFD